MIDGPTWDDVRFWQTSYTKLKKEFATEIKLRKDHQKRNKELEKALDIALKRVEELGEYKKKWADMIMKYRT